MGSHQVFGHRVGNIAAAQARNTPGQDAKGNRHGGRINKQATKCVGQARCKKGHMTNIYLTDSDEEGYSRLMTKPTNTLRIRPGRIA